MSQREKFIKNLSDFETAENTAFAALNLMVEMLRPAMVALGYEPSKFKFESISTSVHNGGSVIVEGRWTCDGDPQTIIIPESVAYADDPKAAMVLYVAEKQRLETERARMANESARIKRYEAAGFTPEEITDFERLQGRLLK